MAIFNTTPATTADEAAAFVASTALSTLRIVDASHRRALDKIWRNPALTPEEFFARAGADGAKLVIGSAETGAYLIAQFARVGLPYVPWAFPAGFAAQPLALNQDGTVTVVRA